MLKSQIIQALERFAPPSLQESWDNTGLQVGTLDGECTGVLICFDVTPAIIEEAISLNYNLVISHHPLFFRGIKQLTGATEQQRSAINAILGDVTIYSSHTAIDSAEGGVSYKLAELLGVTPISVLDPKNDDSGKKTGLGIYGMLKTPVTANEFVDRLKEAIGAKMVRTTLLPDDSVEIRRVAMCGGAGHEYIDIAVALGAQVYITGDLKYHDFVDYKNKILLVDAGHYETEHHIKMMIYKRLSYTFPDFKEIACTKLNDNPINYI